MNPTIKSHPATTLIGNRQTMSFAENKTFMLWNSFMPRRHEIQNKIGEEMHSVQVYPIGFDFNPNTSFEKWAAIAVNDANDIPNRMEKLVIPEGLYAVFLYKGKNTEAESFFRYVFTEWLPESDYILDNRPHFEILGSKYKNNDADSEEEVWIPIQPK
jgi:AraC family transcriptional regulator